MSSSEEEWEAFMAEHRRWMARFWWAWTVLLVVFCAVVVWRFGAP